MHNVRRVQTGTLSAEEIAAQREAERQKLDTYNGLETKYREHRNRGDKHEEALESTTALLTVNPEYYSVWNYRREILEDMFAHDPSRKEQLLDQDMALTQQSMRTHPKVYWLWNHRRWCLESLPSEEAERKWRQELSLVDMMLGMDPRNFMGWNYRRYVIAELAAAMVRDEQEQQTIPPFPSSLSSPALSTQAKNAHLELANEELRYTLKKIEHNFSNFSAWHYRSKLIPRIWDAQGLDETMRIQERDKEFELLQQAMYTDPGDSSIWIYHRWLVSQAPTKRTLDAQIQVIAELLELEPDSKCSWFCSMATRSKQPHETSSKMRRVLC
ncbi:Bet4p [Malassezia vespertilionis]|uniref:Geranylgeranyl transferase type-2 subunit alpha n=1 Tax=Malassezia vespertilionis TaxID=2020962 RepID=A0A2N1J737_9BASI|nr:Bet4p [Malassezia vespertilionis]